MTPQERIEAVARAIFEGRLSHKAGSAMDVWLKDKYDRQAKAAILVTLQSLLEPSEAMWTAWATNPPPFGEAAPSHILSTAISAAIKEHSE